MAPMTQRKARAATSVRREAVVAEVRASGVTTAAKKHAMSRFSIYDWHIEQ
jgi:hypothetical protein